MPALSEVMKNRIVEALDATRYGQRGFRVNYGDSDALVTITRSEYRFVMGSTVNGFTTSEFPGVDSEAAQIFERSDFDSCIRAVNAWADRIVDRDEADILDLFGGVADRNPSLRQK